MPDRILMRPKTAFGFEFEPIHPNATVDMLGLIPEMCIGGGGIVDNIHKNYIDDSALRKLDIEINQEDMSYQYPGDPVSYPLCKLTVGDEKLWFYQSAWVIIKDASGVFWRGRLD